MNAIDAIQIIPSILILIGGVVIIYAAFGARKILSIVSEQYKTTWKSLFVMMIFFSIGYFFAIGFIIKGNFDILPFLVGVVFLGGAAFVFVVVKSSLKVIKETTEQRNQAQKLAQELKDSEQKMRLLNETLTKKNVELQEFNYITSHDLQEPLRTISSFIQIFKEDFGDKIDETADQYIQFITEAVVRMQSLIKVLLDYSRIGQKSEIVSVDLKKLIQTNIKDLHSSINKNQGKVEVIGEMPVLDLPEVEIKQLFQNLISNAIKFHKKETPPSVKIYATELENAYQFSISDNGIGIAKPYQEKVFAIFQRLHNKHEYEGTGIGLAHCRKIVDQFNGEIWVESEEGEGSTFHFTVPTNN